MSLLRQSHGVLSPPTGSVMFGTHYYTSDNISKADAFQLSPTIPSRGRGTWGSSRPYRKPSFDEKVLSDDDASDQLIINENFKTEEQRENDNGNNGDWITVSKRRRGARPKCKLWNLQGSFNAY